MRAYSPLRRAPSLMSCGRRGGQIQRLSVSRAFCSTSPIAMEEVVRRFAVTRIEMTRASDIGVLLATGLWVGPAVSVNTTLTGMIDAEHDSLTSALH